MSLNELLGGLDTEVFFASHWIPGAPLVAQVAKPFLERLAGIEVLRSPEALLKQHPYDVSLFGPDAFRTDISPRAALDFLPRGYNVYVTSVDRRVPEVRKLFTEVACALGLAPWQISLEAFAGTANAVSSRHFDHDVNFQILLEGDKEWTVERNRCIDNPLVAHHPSSDHKGKPHPFQEQTYARSAVPAGFDPEHKQTLRAGAGSVLFLPRAWWHEVKSLNRTWSLNLVIKGQTLSKGLATALQARLHRTPAFRAYVDGLAYGEGAPPSRAAEFEALKRAAIAQIGEITLEEAALSPTPQAHEWTVSERKVQDGVLRVTGKEPVELDEEVGPVVARLAGYQYPFTWDQLLFAAGSLGPIGARNLVDELVELGLLRLAE